MPRDFLIEVGKGNVPGHELVHFIIHSEIVDTDEDLVWCVDDDYAFLTSATVLNITSTDVDDVMADTGAWNVTIFGLDANFAPIKEVIILNGRTPVSTTSSFYRVNGIHTSTAGSTQTNEGTIYAGTGATVDGGPSNIYGVICAGEGWSHMGVYSVKADYNAYMIDGILGTDDDKTVYFGVYYRSNAKVSRTWKMVEHIHVHQNFVYTNYYYVTMPDRADITLKAQVAVGEASVSGLLTVLLVDDGIASGFSMRAASHWMKRQLAREVYIATPTAPIRSLEHLEPIVDGIYCLNIRSGFSFAVADAYKHWYDLQIEESKQYMEKLNQQFSE